MRSFREFGQRPLTQLMELIQFLNNYGYFVQRLYSDRMEAGTLFSSMSFTNPLNLITQSPELFILFAMTPLPLGNLSIIRISLGENAFTIAR